jgi:protein gp37
VGADSGIGWTHHTFNPWWGCVKVSPGCTNCYAESWDRRTGGGHWGPVAPRRFFGENHWKDPGRWARKAAKLGERHRVFCASMADWAEDRPDLMPWRGRLFHEILKSADSLDWLLLTKRIEDAARLGPWSLDGGRFAAPWPNVWFGTTVEDRRRARERLPVLRSIPAVVRFLSLEPLLEPLGDDLDLTGIDWVIAGCESGDGKRPASATWFRDIRDRCARAGVAFFLKQAEPEHGTAGYPSGQAFRPVIIGGGPGAKAKRDGVLEAPYLDGRQHLAYPTPRAVG